MGTESAGGAPARGGTPASGDAPAAGPIAGRIRASDAEREQYARIVREATGDGRLGLDEGDDRLAAVYAAKFRDELAPLVADLGAAVDPIGSGAPGGPRQRGEGPSPEWFRRAFAWHVSVVALVSLALVGAWALTPTHFFWPAIPMIFFALGVVRHARWAVRWRYYRGSYHGYYR